MLLSREKEKEQILDLIAAARSETSNALVIVGDPGIGKSSLLQFARDSADDLLVLTTVGVEGESEFTYANLSDVFRPVYDVIPGIPSRQAAALASAFAIGPPEISDRFVVAAGALGLLSALATRGPVLVTVDDAQWIDRASLETLTFIARRLGAEGVALIFAVRRGYVDQLRLTSFPTLDVIGLADDDARRLISEVSPKPPSSTIVNRLVREAGGNPLALRTLPSLLGPKAMAGWMRGPEPIPIAATLEAAFCRNIRDLPHETQWALTMLAVLGSAPAAVIDQALGSSGIGPQALSSAEEADLINADGGQLGFRHPLIRAAVYQTTPPAGRRRAHLLAADALALWDVPGAAERRAWHLVSAGGVAEESLAASLQSAGEAKFASENFAAAANLMELAAHLTPDQARRGHRLLLAARAKRLSGEIGDSHRLLSQARELSSDRDEQILIDYAKSRIEMWGGALRASRDRLLSLAAASQGRGTAYAIQMLADAALASMELGDLGTAHAASEAAMEMASSAPQGPPLFIAAVRALVVGLRGDTASVGRLLDGRTDGIATAEPLAEDFMEQAEMIVGLAWLAVERIELAATALNHAVSVGRERSTLGLMAWRLGRLTYLQFWRGLWADASATAHEAEQLALDIGWDVERPNALARLSQVEALTDHEGDCRTHAQAAIEMAERAGATSYAMLSHTSLGMLELTRGDHAAAVDHLSLVADFAADNEMADTPLLWWSADLVESYVALDLRVEAELTLRRMATAPDLESRPTFAAMAARCRALLHPEEFEVHLTEALRWHSRSVMPFERARTELLLGCFLRRRRHAEARGHLMSALSVFERLGARQWADRTRQELKTSGLQLPEPAAGLEQLTPQELQVTLAVGGGMSNREVAAKLFLSVKTVEYHLSHVFHKLGIARRTQLAALVARQAGQPA